MNDLRSLGLTEKEVISRREKFGQNILGKSSLRPFFRIVFGAVIEPTVLLLFSIGALYLFLGEKEEFFSLLTFLVLILIITIYQEFKTEKTLKALKELSSPRALVIRNGKKERIPGVELVPDDVIILNEGDRLAADIQITSGGPLSMDESTLSGESFSVLKKSGEVIFAGTLVLKGNGIGTVVKTGEKTELGKIGSSIGEKIEISPLQKLTKKLVAKISLWVLLFTLLIILYYWFTRNNILDGILIGLTLAMAILPNELPAVLLIFLAMAAWRISKRNVLTRKIPAVEALGSVTTLCFDKTGTLTQNKMQLSLLWNGSTELDIRGEETALPEDFHELIEFGILASPVDPFDPMEKALHHLGSRLLKQTEHLHPQWTMFKEYQLTNELLAVSYAWKGDSKGGFIIGAKGATEAIIELCHLPTDEAKKINEQMINMAARGLRIIAIAKSMTRELPPIQHDLDFHFLGLVAFLDPLRADAKDAVMTCQKAGIKLMMMTGDHPSTAMSIGKLCGLKKTGRVLTGTEISKLSDNDLTGPLEDIEIYCRMSPLDKLRIVTLLQKKGEVVGMTGDGVNDAPALKKADIGIAIGERGTDVAREAASIVLLDDNFSSIVAAIKIGRRAFRNLQTTFSYLLAIHVPITIMSIMPVLFKLPLLLLPVHIAFLHLIIEPACTTIFEATPLDEKIMDLPPRKSNAPLLNKTEMINSILQGLIISLMTMGIYFLTKWKGLTSADSRGITFTCLIVINLFLVIILNNNKKMLGVLTLATVSLLGLVFSVPFFRTLFRFEPLHFEDLALIILMSAMAGAIVFILKKNLLSFSTLFQRQDSVTLKK